MPISRLPNDTARHMQDPFPDAEWEDIERLEFLLMKPLILSVKPRFADRIFAGEKTAVELRCRIAPDMLAYEVFVYVTNPVRTIRGGFQISNVWSNKPEKVWNRIASRVGLTKAEYDAYYEGHDTAHALGLSSSWMHEAPANVREALPGFRPPRPWRYAKENELDWLYELKRSAKDSPHAPDIANRHTESSPAPRRPPA